METNEETASWDSVIKKAISEVDNLFPQLIGSTDPSYDFYTESHARLGCTNKLHEVDDYVGVPELAKPTDLGDVCAIMRRRLSYLSKLQEGDRGRFNPHAANMLLCLVSSGIVTRNDSDNAFYDLKLDYETRGERVIAGRVYPHADKYRSDALVRISRAMNRFRRCATCLRPFVHNDVAEPAVCRVEQEGLAEQVRSFIGYNLNCCNTFICGTCVVYAAQKFLNTIIVNCEHAPSDVPVCCVCNSRSHKLFLEPKFMALYVASFYTHARPMRRDAAIQSSAAISEAYSHNVPHLRSLISYYKRVLTNHIRDYPSVRE